MNFGCGNGVLLKVTMKSKLTNQMEYPSIAGACVSLSDSRLHVLCVKKGVAVQSTHLTRYIFIINANHADYMLLISWHEISSHPY